MPQSRKPSSGSAEQARQRFSERYGAGQNEHTVALEREVIGGDYGANSYTTLDQADVLVDALKLAPGQRLLEVGAGRGWPGLYLAERSGCDVVLTDQPAEGISDARRRANKNDMTGKSDCLLAGGATLPFRTRSFHALVQSDVL